MEVRVAVAWRRVGIPCSRWGLGGVGVYVRSSRCDGPSIQQPVDDDGLLEVASKPCVETATDSVSYTHLTLPTIYSV